MMKRPGEKLYSLVFRQIRAYILQNNLQPGDLLPTEQALVEMLGVSRNVLREAIKLYDSEVDRLKGPQVAPKAKRGKGGKAK